MSRENQPEGQQPLDGASIADGLDLFFKSGGFNLPVTAPEQPEIGPTFPQDGGPGSVIGGHIESFVRMISTDRLKAVGGRKAAEAIRTLFEDNWKVSTLRRLEATFAPYDEVEAVATLTLKGVSDYTNERYAHYRKEAAISVPNSPEQQVAREQSNYWSTMAEFISPAADPDDDSRFA